MVVALSLLLSLMQGWLGEGISLFPYIVEVRVAGRGSLSLSLSLTFFLSHSMFWKDRRKDLPKFLVMLSGLAHSHSAGEGRLRKLTVRLLSA